MRLPGRLYVWLPEKPAEPASPPGPTLKPWLAALAADAPNDPNGPSLWNDWACALAADEPNPPSPNCWLKAFAFAFELEKPNPLQGRGREGKQSALNVSEGKICIYKQHLPHVLTERVRGSIRAGSSTKTATESMVKNKIELVFLTQRLE